MRFLNNLLLNQTTQNYKSNKYNVMLIQYLYKDIIKNFNNCYFEYLVFYPPIIPMKRRSLNNIDLVYVTPYNNQIRNKNSNSNLNLNVANNNANNRNQKNK